VEPGNLWNGWACGVRDIFANPPAVRIPGAMSLSMGFWLMNGKNTAKDYLYEEKYNEHDY
jgi:hypothetical protein